MIKNKTQPASRHYNYDLGRKGDMPLLGFSYRKAASIVVEALI